MGSDVGSERKIIGKSCEWRLKWGRGSRVLSFFFSFSKAKMFSVYFWVLMNVGQENGKIA